ncbi:MAG: ABC transporter permease [Actinomycetota bacterium]|nr:ABC transporter permease [Actinomycetota bacterium]
MTDIATTVPDAPESVRATAPLAGIADMLIRSILPLLLALVAGGALVAALGHNPFSFYLDIYRGGIELDAWQDSLMRAATLVPIALGLIVVFRANIWNLGYQGQFLLSAAMVAGLGPHLERHLSATMTLIVLFLVAGATGAAWTLIPAILKAWYQTNEIITTLMMTFIGISLSAILVKGPFQDFSTNVPETLPLPLDDMLPTIPGTRTHVGVVIAAVLVLVVHYTTTRTSFGLKLQVLGANPRAAVHVGLDPKRVILSAFICSGALVGVAAAVEILGIWGYMRADFNPAYGDAVIPFVFLARLNALAVVPFILFYSVLSIGGDLAAQDSGLPVDFLLVIVGLTLLFMVFIEYLGRNREMGRTYVTPGLRDSLRFRKPK